MFTLYGSSQAAHIEMSSTLKNKVDMQIMQSKNKWTIKKEKKSAKHGDKIWRRVDFD